MNGEEQYDRLLGKGVGIGGGSVWMCQGSFLQCILGKHSMRLCQRERRGLEIFAPGVNRQVIFRVGPNSSEVMNAILRARFPSSLYIVPPLYPSNKYGV
jgi:hypothetical protein